jgi:prenyltransferase beta subunit
MIGAQGDSAVKVEPATEVVINRGLRYLVSHQAPNGAWLGRSEKERNYPIAMTAYTLLAFLSTGHLPGEGEYGRNVSLGVDYLLSQVSPEGLIGDRDNGQYMYFHGIATIALAELYGQTNAASIRTKLERLIKIIVSSQNQDGGWRYRPTANDADISVTVLQVVALRAAKNSGLKVPQATIDQAVKYVRSCYNESDGGFSYQPDSETGFARTAAAIYSLQVCGHYDDPRVAKGSVYLLEHLAERGRWFTYGNFYAAPAQYMIGGDTWAKWYNQVKPELISKVIRDHRGVFWQPIEGNGVNEIFTTAVFTTILAMSYHYLPLYQR